MSKSNSIQSLTTEQEAALPRYRQLGIDLGLAIGPDMDEGLVRELTDKHRVACGLKPAERFIVEDSPFAATDNHPGLTPFNALYGQHDSYWLISYLFFRVECGLRKETEKVVNLIELCKHVNWMWMGNFTTVVTRRPAYIQLLARAATSVRVLHNPDGMALRYRDGRGLYRIEGNLVPEELVHLINAPAQDISVEEVLNIVNTELRTAFINKIGISRVFSTLNSEVVHEGTIPKGGHYTLYSVSIGEDNRRYLSGVCPSKGDRWYEAVPPTVNTVTEANHWREWGTISSNYLPPLVRT